MAAMLQQTFSYDRHEFSWYYFQTENMKLQVVAWVLRGGQLLPEPILTKMSDAIWHHLAITTTPSCVAYPAAMHHGS